MKSYTVLTVVGLAFQSLFAACNIQHSCLSMGPFLKARLLLQACPVTKDDSWEKYFKATIDSWQQQAVGPLPGAPAASAAAAGKGGPAAGKDRASRAAAALERYLAEQQQPRQPASVSPANSDTPVATTAAKDVGKIRGKSADNSSSGELKQQQRPKSGTPGVVVRQLKGGSSMELAPEKHLQRLAAATAGASQPSAELSNGSQDSSSSSSSQGGAGGLLATCPKLLSPEELAAKAKASLDQEARDVAALAKAAAAQEERKKELAGLQAKKVRASRSRSFTK